MTVFAMPSFVPIYSSTCSRGHVKALEWSQMTMSWRLGTRMAVFLYTLPHVSLGRRRHSPAPPA
ncbi:hypothetical protein DSO57_1036568 [Entomophthora muscae]|uniref:Uncharacterized protein n=1 Tax=Entomophthora muscae TaxID=34485 RepID=A0ACC2RQ82_9FUNG|nr:hypothetical protein DSO57_1036568 [Entomophthora muscae]